MGESLVLNQVFVLYGWAVQNLNNYYHDDLKFA